MPKLEIPKTQGKIKVTQPPQIPYPGYLAGQAYQGQKQLAASLIDIGKQFLNSISSSRAASEQATAERDINALYFQTLRDLENEPEPLNYNNKFLEFKGNAEKRITQISHRGARGSIQNWYNQNISTKQHEILQLGLRKEWANQQAKMVTAIEDDFRNPIIPKEKQSLADAAKDRISSIEVKVSNAQKTVVGGRTIFSVETAQQFINRANLEIPMKVAVDNAYYLGRVEGLGWLKKNWKELGLTVKTYGIAQEQLKEVWEDEEAIAIEQAKLQKQQLLDEMIEDTETSNYLAMAQKINDSNLSIEIKQSLTTAVNAGRVRRNQARITEKDFPASQVVYQELLELAPKVASGKIDVKEGMGKINLAYIAGDLGTGAEAKTKFEFLKTTFRKEITAARADAISWVIDNAKDEIVFTGADKIEASRIQTLFEGLDIMSPEEFGEKRRKELVQLNAFIRKVEESTEIADATPEEIRDIGLKMLRMYKPKSLMKDIEKEAWENYKKIFGITPEDIEKGDYDYLDAFRDNVWPRRWSELSAEELAEIGEAYVVGEKEAPTESYIWPEEYKTPIHEIGPKTTKPKGMFGILTNPEEKLEVLRMYGGPAAIEQIDKYLETGMKPEEILNSMQNFPGLSEELEKYLQIWGTKTTWEGATIVNPITGERKRWDGKKWQPVGKTKIKRGGFNPEGTGYDEETAKESGLEPNKAGHWGSLDPQTGMVLKGRKHPTWDLMVKEEEKLGRKIIKKGKRYYSVEK